MEKKETMEGKRLSHTQRELQMQEDILKVLHKEISILEDNLITVLRNDDEPSPVEEQMESDNLVPLANNIRENSSYIHEAVKAIQRINERLEL